jgi:hypothetical protein
MAVKTTTTDYAISGHGPPGLRARAHDANDVRKYVRAERASRGVRRRTAGAEHVRGNTILPIRSAKAKATTEE